MLKTRLTDTLGIELPILQAPMAFAAGGALASAVTQAGGLGLIGGGYGDKDWIDREFNAAGNAAVGCGFITWSLGAQPELLSHVLEKKPKVIFLSFGDPAPFVEQIKNAGIKLICQIQTFKDAKYAVDLGADIIVAQGGEAGGHGEKRATFTLVPEVADYIARFAPDVLLLAAGGIADGRGLAASLMLGADGVLIGSRLWASHEALVHPNMHKAAIAATGDDTLRSSVMDIARKRDWPKRYTARVLQNDFTQKWHGNEAELIQNDNAAAGWAYAWETGDVDNANTFVGEAAAMIHDIKPAKEIIQSIIASAKACLKTYG
jgi:nitronate monooxygenase